MSRGGVRPGAGRKPGSTKAEELPTKVVRVSVELPSECYQRLPNLLAIIDEYQEQIAAAKVRGKLLRTYEKLANRLLLLGCCS